MLPSNIGFNNVLYNELKNLKKTYKLRKGIKLNEIMRQKINTQFSDHYRNLITLHINFKNRD